MKRSGFLAAALAASITVACGGGTDRNTGTADNTTIAPGTADSVGTSGNATGVPRDVENFVNEAAMHNTAEIELGKIAAQKGTSPQVKQFGEMMVREHTMAGNELKQAVGNRLTLHEQMDDDHRELAQKLNSLSGMEFDRQYINAMVDGHDEVRDLLDDRADDARNNNTTGTSGSTANANDQLEMSVNQWAAKTLPAVEQHLARAKQLQETIARAGTR